MKKSASWLLAAVAAVTTLTAGGAVAHASMSPAPVRAITWGTCPTPGADSKQQCGTLEVPLDYRRPNGRLITIAVSRIPATNPAQRRGVLLLNPGGPGGEGLDMPTSFAQSADASVSAAYDLIGFDPRGIGHSTPVTCGLTASEMIPAYPYPAPNGSIKANVAYAKSTAKRCQAKSGDLLPYITTANTARDMDAIRAALGEKKISYYGTSYGTYLGAVYSTLYSTRTDRVLLDSGVDPDKVWYSMFRSQGAGLEIRFPDATTYVSAHAATYRLGRTAAAVKRSYTKLTAALDAKPRTVPQAPVPLSGNVLRAATASLLLSDQNLPMLGESWRAATDLVAGHATDEQIQFLQGLLGAIDLTTIPSPGVPADNFLAASYALACDDVAWPSDPKVYAGNVAADRAAYPVADGSRANIWPCAFWPTKPVEPPVKVSDRGARTIMILQNERDPATPLKSGRGLHAALGARSVMVTIKAGGHIAYGTQGPTACSTRTANAFLVKGTLPARDVHCA